jgi:hypothetical protein
VATPEQIEAAARSDAQFDGQQTWLSMPRGRRERYLERAKLALEAAEKIKPFTHDKTS